MNKEIKEKIKKIAESDVNLGISNKFSEDDKRLKAFSYDFSGMYFDFSKTHISKELLACYQSYAGSINFKVMREQLFSGERINSTENRSVLHMLLRDSNNQNIDIVEDGVIEQAKKSESDFFEKYDEIISNLDKRNEPIKDIIHVGIGGSSLGTQLVFEALKELNSDINVHFISNIDAHKLTAVLNSCSVKNTLLIGISKTFTTAETLQNINTVGKWFDKHGVEQWRQQLLAVTANPDNALKFGLNKDNIVGFPEWVGGRYSVWSAVSLSAVIAIGMDAFKEFLKGAAEMDEHFYQTPLDQNICFISAALDHYYSNFLGVRSRAIFPYDDRLRSLVYYLQQLETESNGKDRQRDGSPVDQTTSVVIWGGIGTDVQHSVFQMMHQGTSIIPAEFILIKKPNHEYDDHHSELLANGLAQTAALLSGQDLATVKKLNEDKEVSEITLKAKIFSGERPSTTILLDQLTAKNLGALLACYEHRTFCLGVFLNINSYDQMGVELGKRLAKTISPYLDDDNELDVENSGLDNSTIELIRRVTN